MTEEQVLVFVAELTYKPGCRFNCHKVATGGVAIGLVMEVPDSEHKDKPLTFVAQGAGIGSAELECMQPADLVRRVEGLVADLERHESQEWLKWRGERLTEPHPNE